MISEDKLRQAAKEYERVLLDSLPNPEECEASFSPAFERKMRRLIRQTKHPLGYWLRRSAAVFLLVLLCAGGLLTGSAEARTAFVGWIREVHETYFSYRYTGPNAKVPENTAFLPAWIPEGYEIVSESHTDMDATVLYQNQAGELAMFTYSMNTDSIDLKITGNTVECQHVLVGSSSADLYIDPVEENNMAVLVWADDKVGATFGISAEFDADSMIKMAESVEPINVD